MAYRFGKTGDPQGLQCVLQSGVPSAEQIGEAKNDRT